MKTIWPSALCMLLIASPALAQAPSASSTVDSASTLPQGVQLTARPKTSDVIDLLMSTTSDAPLWADKTTATWFLANAADVVWADRPEQALTLVRTAWKLTDEVPDGLKNEKLRDFFRSSSRADLRTTVLSVAQKHDQKLAEELLKELTQPQAKDETDRGAFDDRTARSEQLLRMAEQVVDSKPELAFSLAARSLPDGLSYSLQNVLTSLRLKNIELANRLFDSALARFAGSYPDPAEAQVLAGYLFQSGFTFSANSTGQTILVINPLYQNLAPIAATDPQRARAFLRSVYQTLLSQPVVIDSVDARQRAQQTLILASRLISSFDSFDPELAPAARGMMVQLRGQLYPEGQAPTAEQSSRSDESTDSTKRLTKEEIYDRHISALEEKADRQSDPVSRKLGYLAAAIATTPRDYERAIRIAAKIEDDDNLRNDATSFLLYRVALAFIAQDEVGKAEALKPKIHDFPRRAVLDIAIAQHLIATVKNPDKESIELQHAFDLLSEIQDGLQREKSSPKLAKIALARTAILARFDRTQGLAALAETMQTINHVDMFDLRDSSAPALGLDDSISSATIATPKLGFDFRSAIEPLIPANFAEVTAAAETLRSREARGVARLEIVRLFLSQTGRKEPKASVARMRR